MSASNGPIVVGILPGRAIHVLETAKIFARQFRARLVVAHVNASRYTGGYDPDGAIRSFPLVPDGSEGRREKLDPELEGMVTATLDGSGVEWSVQALAGIPARELEMLADRVAAQMIIVGTRPPGRTEHVRELLAGAVAEHLTHHQQRPVVIVPSEPIDNTRSPSRAGRS